MASFGRCALMLCGLCGMSAALHVSGRRVVLSASGEVVFAAMALSPLVATAAEMGPRYVDQVVVDASGREIGKARRLEPDDWALEYQKKEVTEEAFQRDEWPATAPFTAKNFRRLDESDDSNFYAQPRLVYHIDDLAVAALTHYYKEALGSENKKILDVCSSWVSHLPKGTKGAVGVGMNSFELENNLQLDSFVARDLNKNPTLPYADDTFDVATLVVSIDYLTKPIEVLSEIKRVLKKPSGRLIISQSNRCFYTKAVEIWLSKGDDLDHLDLIGQYLHYAGFDNIRAFDITAKQRTPFAAGGNNKKSDPLYIVDASVA